jgi:hypothetical protein
MQLLALIVAWRYFRHHNMDPDQAKSRGQV